MNNNQLITFLSVQLCDLCFSVLEKLFNTETTKNTQSITENKILLFDNE